MPPASRAKIILLLQGLLMVAICFAPFAPASWVASAPLAPRSPGVRDVGAAVLGLIGLSICLLAMRALGKSFTIHAVPKQNARLITAGPFQIVRNPMYFGGLLMSVAWAILFASWLAGGLTAVLALVLSLKIEIEETQLAARFGPEFTDYRARTKKLIPYLF